jgi:hypothetical protein
MPFLIICFVLFFGIAEVYPFVEGFTIPTPAFVIAGIVLAIASNYNKPAVPWRSLSNSTKSLSNPSPKQSLSWTTHPPQAQQHPIASTPSNPSSAKPAQSQSQSKAEPQLPKFDPHPQQSISFIIRRPHNPQ